MEIVGIILAVVALGIAIVTYVAPSQGWFGAPSLRFSYGAHMDYNFELWVDVENKEVTDPLLKALKVYRLDANISIHVQAEQIGDSANKAGPLRLGDQEVLRIVGGTTNDSYWSASTMLIRRQTIRHFSVKPMLTIMVFMMTKIVIIQYTLKKGIITYTWTCDIMDTARRYVILGDFA